MIPRPNNVLTFPDSVQQRWLLRFAKMRDRVFVVGGNVGRRRRLRLGAIRGELTPGPGRVSFEFTWSLSV